MDNQKVTNQMSQRINKIGSILGGPILYTIIQFMIVLVIMFSFQFEQMNRLERLHPNWESTKIESAYDHFIQSNDGMNQMAEYMLDYTWVVILINVIIVLPILIHCYKKYRNRFSKYMKRKSIFNVAMLSICCAILFNLGVSPLAKMLAPANNEVVITSSFIILIVSAGIVGPIIEELLFRGIVYSKLLKTQSKTMAMILSSLLFAILHLNITQIIYAFLMGLFFAWCYSKYETIKAPIAAHIAANCFVQIVMPSILALNIWLTVGLFILTAIIGIYFIQRIKYENCIYAR